MKKSHIYMGMLVMLGASAMPFTAGADGAAIAKEKCAACHGEDGNSKYGKVPSIAGFSEMSLTDMINAYKSGDRTGDKFKPDNGDESDMNTVAKDLSDADIASVAGYLSGQTFKRHAQKADAALAARGKEIHDKKCEKCHSEGGTNADDDAAILAGQWKEYLEMAFAKISAGDQQVPKKMKKKFKKLSDEDKKALIEYYISQN